MVVHLAAASHYISDVLEFPAVAGAARKLLLFENVDVFALHLAVADEVARRGESGETAAHDVG